MARQFSSSSFYSFSFVLSDSSYWGFRSFETRPSVSLQLLVAVFFCGVLGFHLLSRSPGNASRTEIDTLSFQNALHDHQDFLLFRGVSLAHRLLPREPFRSGPRREVGPLDPSQVVNFIDNHNLCLTVTFALAFFMVVALSVLRIVSPP
ncbi:hypothetical protein DFH09DRAFT_1178863 [Mycena vulgaris]|nr:hypothetical protein DFH09DRAFT_1178863 [Mycena vulgaris]